MDVVSQVAVAIATFVATNLDDLFLVTAYFADTTLRRSSIVGGQSDSSSPRAAPRRSERSSFPRAGRRCSASFRSASACTA